MLNAPSAVKHHSLEILRELCMSPGHALKQCREVVLFNMLDVKLSDLFLCQHHLSLESHSKARLVDLCQDLFCRTINIKYTLNCLFIRYT